MVTFCRSARGEKNAILGLGLGLGLQLRLGLDLGLDLVLVRENRILDGNQLVGPHKDSNTKLCVCVCVRVCVRAYDL